MASSVVDICNLALAHLGDKAQVIAIVPPDGTIQAAQCGRFYPLALNQMLEVHPWTFAMQRKALALVASPPADGPPHEWGFAYVLPSDCVKPRAIYRPDAFQDGRGEDFIVENGMVYTNVEDAILRYTRLIEDTTRFTHGFVTALARLLASFLAGPIIKGTTGMQVAAAQYKMWGVELGIARSDDSNSQQRSEYATRIPDMVRARGIPPYSNPYRWRNGGPF